MNLTDVHRDLNRQLWESKAIDGYHFEHRWICFCIQDFVAPVDVTVDGSEIIEVRYLDDEPHRSAPDAAQYYTIPGLFNMIQDAIVTGAHSLAVEVKLRLQRTLHKFMSYRLICLDPAHTQGTRNTFRRRRHADSRVNI